MGSDGNLSASDNYVICSGLRRDNVITWTLRRELPSSHHSLLFDRVKFSKNKQLSGCICGCLGSPG